MNGNDEINGEIMIVAIVVLSCVVLFTFALHLYAKWFWRRSGTLVGSWSSRPRFAEEERERRAEAGAAAAADSGSRSNVGLEKAVVEALPLFVFRSQSSDDVLDCAVCLSGFEENERGRILPKCNHAFHVECIETWFRSHSTCPLCRSTVHVLHLEPPQPHPHEYSHSASSSSSWEMPPLADLEAAEGEEGPSSSSSAAGDSGKSTVTRIRSLRRILGRENIKVFPSNHEGSDVEAGGQAQAQEQDQS